MRASFEKVPDAVLNDVNLSLNARGLYGVLKLLAYRNGRAKDKDAVPMPTLAAIAKLCDCSVSSLRAYIGELKGAGWVKTIRANRAHPMLYAVLDSNDSSAEIYASTDVSSAEIYASRARDPLKTITDTSASHSLEVADEPVPKLVQVEGQNLGYNALREVCKIAPTSPRAREIPAALNGGKTVPIGIREQFWREAVAASAHGIALSTDPVDFEHALAGAIVQRAVLYRKVFKDVTMTPTALAKWWTDLPTLVSEGDSLAARLARHADELRREGR